jgi:erythromycin esterase-like protein
MDLYSLLDSAQGVVSYLEGVDPQAAGRARERYKCFERFQGDPQRYGQAVALGSTRSCEREAEQQFQEMQGRVVENARKADRQPNDELFAAYQNARVVKNGEAYYRTLYRGGASTWNLRDHHMAETLNSLLEHFDSLGGAPTKVVVWAHNTHQGDARGTEMSEEGELNVGQLMRQRHGDRSILVGFTTYTGEVMAASAWGRRGERMKVRPALPESYSALFHETGIPNFLLPLRDGGRIGEELARPRLERAIGVVYVPRTEWQTHYFRAQLSKQFDAVIHLDVTSAIEPLN